VFKPDQRIQYLSLDPTTPDQFIAIRADGTWAGSIDPANEEALSSFVANYFHLSTSQSKSNAGTSSSQSHTNGFHTPPNSTPRPPDPIPDPATQALYEKWATDTATNLASALAANTSTKRAPKKLQIRSPSQTGMPSSIPSSANSVQKGKLLTAFPYLPRIVTICQLPSCTVLKADTEGLRACKHDVERLLRASGLYSYEWLRQERIRWHPDRFGRLCAEGWREEGKKLAEEMFKVIETLMGEIKT
jgi:hypothetical protein